MNLNPSFFQEEVRSGFLVTAKQKKVWAVELRILERFSEVCKKHHLTWYAYYGTLLGAVRHQGFIPWDNDIDVVMLRDDYARFCTVAPEEFTEPYHFQPVAAFCKICDSRTTAINPQSCDLTGNTNHGIFIDIFPFDSIDDGTDPQFSSISQVQQLLWVAITQPHIIQNALETGKRMFLGSDFLTDYLKKTFTEQLQIFEALNLSCFGKTQKVNYILDELFSDLLDSSLDRSVDIACFLDIVYLPFENIELPAPAGYDAVLTQSYGNYHQPVRGASAHEGILMEPDIPYSEVLSLLSSSGI